jgi:hypothetical protein
MSSVRIGFLCFPSFALRLQRKFFQKSQAVTQVSNADGSGNKLKEPLKGNTFFRLANRADT